MPVQLKRIIMFNFKSFSGEVTVGPIQPFTAITGANGSGKSNIMDAISFVMGEKIRNLRVENVSQLIYGATKGAPSARRARVTIIFELEDNSSKSFMRSIYRSSCEYKIDDKTVTIDAYMSGLRELNLNVKAANFLIFQGAIDSMIMKTPKEYTSMFEEISNSVELTVEYERLKNEISKVEVEVQHLTRKKKELLKRKSCARLGKEQAEMYNKLHNEYLNKKRELYLFELFHIEEDARDLKEKLTNAIIEEKKLENEKAIVVKGLEEQNTEYKKALQNLESVEDKVVQAENNLKDTEARFTGIKEKVSFWQNKLNFYNSLLSDAEKARELHENTLKELENELKEVERTISMLEADVASQVIPGSGVELNDIQVERYLKLRQAADARCSVYERTLNVLEREQNINQNKLDNANRKKYELQVSLQNKNLLFDETVKRVNNLRRYISETENLLSDKENVKVNLENEISRQKEDINNAERELQRVSELLSTAEQNKYLSSRLKRENETIEILQSRFSGVYGRLYNLVQPAHSRYEVAMTKVFGRHCNSIIVSTNTVAIQCIKYLKDEQIGIETFLPISDLRVKPIDKLRRIMKGRNVKLLYDVLHVKNMEADNAILFATKNTFVCETVADVFPGFNCITLDGTYYTKDGLISGGQVECLERAKVWHEQDLIEMKSKKAMFREKLKDKMKIPESESEIRTLDIETQCLKKKLKYFKQDLNDAESKLVTLEKEIEDIKGNLKTVNDEVAFVTNIIKEKDREIQEIQKTIMDSQDLVFEDFCKEIGVLNIRQYEQGNLRLYQEQMKRKSEWEEQYSRIQSVLDFERNRDVTSVSLKLKKKLKDVEEELSKSCQLESLARVDMERCVKRMNDLQRVQNERLAKINNLKESANESKRMINAISKSIISSEKVIVGIKSEMQKRKAKCIRILKDIKIEGIAIPLLENANSSQILVSESPSTEETETVFQALKVNFRELSVLLKDRTEANINKSRNDLMKTVEKLESKMGSIKDPNFKASDHLDSIAEEYRELNTKLRQVLDKSKDVKREFESKKQERYDRFSTSFERIVGELDSIFKRLLNDESAQAILSPDNPEEPYLGGINYSCIMPGKRFQPLSNLSLGEKTMAVLALSFAIHSFRPAPFFVFDEIDSSLDTVHVDKVTRFIIAKAKEMQFIVISLESRLFSCADALIGVCVDISGSERESLLFSCSLKEYAGRRIDRGEQSS